MRALKLIVPVLVLMTVSCSMRSEELMMCPKGMTLISGGEYYYEAAGSVVYCGHKDNEKICSYRMDYKIPTVISTEHSKAFCIDKYEVPIEDYLKCFEAKKCSFPDINHDGFEPEGNYPVTGVSWEDAKNYCEFAGKILPDDKMWTRAARYDHKWIYPWGMEEVEGNKANYCDPICKGEDVKGKERYVDGFRYTAPNDQTFLYGSSQNVVMNLSGNVFEWVNGDLEMYLKDLEKTGMVKILYDDNYYKNMKMMKGGSWSSDPEYLKIGYRFILEKDAKQVDVGFRCAYTGKKN